MKKVEGVREKNGGGGGGGGEVGSNYNKTIKLKKLLNQCEHTFYNYFTHIPIFFDNTVL